MPLQNRVDPHGALIVTPARGTFMGNRGGVLHAVLENGRREIVRQYASRRWIACLLEFKGRHRTVMSPNRYTELFFLDEAVALAAGHRPCAECRRERFNAFREAWSRATRRSVPNADEMDVELHRARIDGRTRKVTFQARLDSLPDGCFVEIGGSSYLVSGDSLLLWSPEGYAKKIAKPRDEMVAVLTPEPMVRCLRGGYKAEIHSSARLLP